MGPLHPWTGLLLAGVLATVVASAQTRAPEPDAGAQAEVRRVLRDLYREEFASRRSEERVALARKLLEDARMSTTTTTTRYVLLQEARELAAGAGAVEESLEAVEELAAQFEIDGLTLERETIAALRKSTRDVATLARLLEPSIDLVERAIDVSRHDIATTLLRETTDLARRARSRWHVAALRVMKEHVEAIESEYSLSRASIEAVEPGAAAGADSASSRDRFAAGQYHCLYRGDWERGLPLMAAGNNAAFAAAARADLDRPRGAEESLLLADTWWELARDKSELPRLRLRNRAALWYGFAVPALSGARARDVISRIDEVRRSLRPVIPRLPTRGGLSFNGAGAHVAIPGFRYDGSHPLTVEVLVEVRRAPSSRATVVGNKSGGGFAVSIERGGRWFFVFHAGDEYHHGRSEAPVVTGKLTHVAGVFDGRNVMIFVDGELQRRTGQASARHTASSLPLLIGADPDDGGGTRNALDGSVDAVRISRRARYSRDFSPPAELERDADTMLLLHLDEREGNHVIDHSGHGHHGTAVDARRVGWR